MQAKNVYDLLGRAFLYCVLKDTTVWKDVHAEVAMQISAKKRQEQKKKRKIGTESPDFFLERQK